MRLEIQVEQCENNTAKLVIGPLERGYGQTIGNALRRVLLSSIRGAAISAVSIEGVQHEFTTIPGMKEDVIELLLNLKHVPVRSHSAEYRTLRLDFAGGGVVTADAFQKDDQIEFIDPNAYICTMAEGCPLSLEVYIEQGVGYATVERPRPEYLPVGALMIDAVYSPVLRVKYEVQAERVGQVTDYEKIVMNIVTNGVVEPDVAAGEAAKLLSEYFNIVREELAKLHPDNDRLGVGTTTTVPDGAEGPTNSGGTDNVLLSKAVKELELTIRSENCLLRGGIHTIGELVSRSKDDLLKIRNLGKISLREIEEKLEKIGLKLNDEKTSAESTNKED